MSVKFARPPMTQMAWIGRGYIGAIFVSPLTFSGVGLPLYSVKIAGRPPNRHRSSRASTLVPPPEASTTMSPSSS